MAARLPYFPAADSAGTQSPQRERETCGAYARWSRPRRFATRARTAGRLGSGQALEDSGWAAEQVYKDACSHICLVPVERVVENVDLVVIEDLNINVVDCR